MRKLNRSAAHAALLRSNCSRFTNTAVLYHYDDIEYQASFTQSTTSSYRFDYLSAFQNYHHFIMKLFTIIPALLLLTDSAIAAPVDIDKRICSTCGKIWRRDTAQVEQA